MFTYQWYKSFHGWCVPMDRAASGRAASTHRCRQGHGRVLPVHLRQLSSRKSSEKPWGQLPSSDVGGVVVLTNSAASKNAPFTVHTSHRSQPQPTVRTDAKAQHHPAWLQQEPCTQMAYRTAVLATAYSTYMYRCTDVQLYGTRTAYDWLTARARPLCYYYSRSYEYALQLSSRTCTTQQAFHACCGTRTHPDLAAENCGLRSENPLERCTQSTQAENYHIDF
eukprot:COSAG01_NODE_7602_length_3130_cov_5.113164_1_plen_223_part_00